MGQVNQFLDKLSNPPIALFHYTNSGEEKTKNRHNETYRVKSSNEESPS